MRCFTTHYRNLCINFIEADSRLFQYGDLTDFLQYNIVGYNFKTTFSVWLLMLLDWGLVVQKVCFLGRNVDILTPLISSLL